MRRCLAVLLASLVLARCAPTPAPAPAPALPDPKSEYARIQLACLEKTPVGAWIEYDDATGKRQRATVRSREPLDGGSWKVTIEDPSNPSVDPTVEIVYGPDAAELKDVDHGPLAMSDDELSVGGHRVACKAFAMADGRKRWMSADVPLGLVKEERPAGRVTFTLVEAGER